MIWVDGLATSMIPADDPGLLLGLTAFETMRVYGRHVFRLERHLDRLEVSARELDIPMPARELAAAEISQHAVPDGYVRYTLTAGGRRILQTDALDASKIGAPLRAAFVDWDPSPWLPGAVKHGSRAAWVLAARRLEVDEVILVDRQGFMLEANRSNVLGVLDDVLVTPPLDARLLAGVTRGAMLDAAEEAGIELREAAMPREAVYAELYCVSTLKELSPITELDGRPGPGDGPLGEALHRAFRRLVAREAAG